MFSFLTRSGLWVRHKSGQTVLIPNIGFVLPVLTAVFFLMVLAAASHISVAKAVYLLVTAPTKESLSNAFQIAKGVNVKTVRTILTVETPANESELPTLKLTVPKNTLEEMFALHDNFYKSSQDVYLGEEQVGEDDIDAHPYFKAMLTDENNVLTEVKIKLRGLSRWHHEKAKPSLRVKHPKDSIYRGWRYSELTRPKDGLAVSNWLPDSIGKNLGLMSDKGDHVRLFINNKYYGVYRRTRRLGEPLAIANGRMPGTFFKADFARGMWDSADAWKIDGEDSPQNRRTFQEFLDTLKTPVSAESIDRMNSLVNSEKLASWSAMNIVSGSAHTDYEHNHCYFVNTNEGLIERIPWDIGFAYYHSADLPVDLLTGDPLEAFLLCDPNWRHRRNQILYQLINEAESHKSIHSIAATKIEQLLPDLRTDRHLQSMRWLSGHLYQMPWDGSDLDKGYNDLKSWIDDRSLFLNEYLADSKVSVEPIPSKQTMSRITVAGSVGVTVSDLTKKTDPILLHPGLSSDAFSWRRPRHPDWDSKAVGYLRPTAIVYDIPIERKNIEIRNAITGQKLTFSKNKIDTVGTRTINHDELAKKPSGEIRLGPGLMKLDKDLYISQNQTLVIEPDTEIRLASGVGIYSRGQVLAKGTAEKPISILSASEDPWAAFGISGEQTRGTHFRYVSIEGGSTGTLDGILFKGMLSIYNCPELTFENCHVGRNYVGDDAVNFAQSDVLIDQCTWSNALSDALDLDMCTGVVKNSTWIDSGNDAIDLMQCKVSISNCHCEGSGDKGISVGEQSIAMIINCSLEKCFIGVEIKDASKALIRRSTLAKNQTAVHSYQKKWMFSKGGETLLEACSIDASVQADFDIERRSHLYLLHTNKGRVHSGESRIVEVQDIPADFKSGIFDETPQIR